MGGAELKEDDGLDGAKRCNYEAIAQLCFDGESNDLSLFYHHKIPKH